MFKETPQNLARLAMTLSHQVGVKENNLNAMRGIFLELKLVIELIRKKDFPGSVPVPNDMEAVEWQSYVGMLLAQLAAQKMKKTCGPDAGVTMWKHVEAAVQALVENPETADIMARSVLGQDLYPTEKGLPDGHHKRQ